MAPAYHTGVMTQRHPAPPLGPVDIVENDRIMKVETVVTLAHRGVEAIEAERGGKNLTQSGNVPMPGFVDTRSYSLIMDKVPRCRNTFTLSMGHITTMR